mgnify:CR=1 FL=1
MSPNLPLQFLVVSIHAPARGATLKGISESKHSMVSIHAPARGATNIPRAKNKDVKFQSTRPRGARLCIRLDDKLSRVFQSTRPRGARPALPKLSYRQPSVSIHAPARGATLPGQRGCLVLQSFNPRARAGRDSWRTINFTSTPSFNPRARAGRDLSARGAALGSSVSIHAPARGATKTGARRSGLGSGFNPRARAGRDALNRYFGTGIAAFQSTRPRGARRRYGKGLEDTLAFQSTRPRGARPQISLTARMSPCFNPRARAGRDGSVRSSQS